MIHPGPFDNVAQQDVIVINITCQVMARRVNTFWDAISTSTGELLLFSCWLVLLARSDRGIVYNGKDMRRWCRERERENWFSTHIRVPDVPAKSHQLAASWILLRTWSLCSWTPFQPPRRPAAVQGAPGRSMTWVPLERDGQPKHPKATGFQDRHHQFWMILPPVSGNPRGTYDWIFTSQNCCFSLAGNEFRTRWKLCPNIQSWALVRTWSD